MPEICRFFGIIISMNYNDHAPPHFHARYGSQKVIIDIRQLRIIEGSLSPRVFGMIMEWASLHRDDLLQIWDLARQNQPLPTLEPLE
jgi:hypothetical protein